MHRKSYRSMVAIAAGGLVLTILAGLLFYAQRPLPDVGWLESLLGNDSLRLYLHARSTLWSAMAGFLIGCTAGMATSIVGVISRIGGRAITPIAILLYSVPLIGAAPLTALIFGAGKAGIALACMGSFLPVYLSGMRAADRAFTQFAEAALAHGAGRWAEVRYVRIPIVMRGWISGARTGWVWAVLGALLGDFTGGRWGLGTFLIGSLTAGSSARVWVVVVLCLGMSCVGFLALFVLEKLAHLTWSLDPLDALGGIQYKQSPTLLTDILLYGAWGLALVALWQVVASYSGFEHGIFASPTDLVQLLGEIQSGDASISGERLLSIFLTTSIWACVGVIGSLATAFIIASIQSFQPTIGKVVILPVLVTQVTPIVVFVPLIAYYFGRGDASVVLIVILSTVYPAYVVFSRGLNDVPVQSLDIVRSFGGGTLAEYGKLRLPSALWSSIIALRLTVSRALLGAITAEYLITGTGIGGLLGEAKAFLDFRVIWLVSVCVGGTTLLADVAIVASERIGRWKLVDAR